MGPCLVTADEIPDPYNLTMIARVNGEEWGRGNSNSMYWKFEDLISYITRSETLYPGEFLGACTSRSSAPSVAFAVISAARHSLVPLRG